MKKTPVMIGAGAASIAGLFLTIVQWTSGELKTKASAEEVHQINHDINRMDEKIEKLLYYVADMQKTLNVAHGGRGHGSSREDTAHIGSNSSGAVVPSH